MTSKIFNIITFSAEYDPYTPDLPIAPVLDDAISGAANETCDDTLELERVNKAIEEVKNEVEREQRKYEELLEIQKEYIPSVKRSCKSVSSHLEYSPVGSGSSALTYNPTQLSHSHKPCKYTLDDCGNKTNKRNCMEYIPTAKAKHLSKKYVIDNSKPSTDMEYDPMSNYSARLLHKATHKKETKNSRDRNDEGAAPYAKKIRRQSSDSFIEATFSDSENDSDSPLHLNKSILLTGEKKKSINEFSVHCKTDDVEQPKKSKSKDPLKKVSHINSKSVKKELVTEAPLCANFDKPKATSKGQKKEKKYLAKKTEIADKKKGRFEGGKKEKKDSILSEKNVRLNTDISVKNKEKSHKAQKEKANSSVKESKHRAGDNREKKKVKDVKSESLGKSKVPKEKTLKARTKQRTLSHVDLFGDESSEEEQDKNQNHSASCEKVANSTEKMSTSRRRSTSSRDSSEMDYSMLEIHWDSDPEEECLRVFQESQDVKTEDKGRKGKQVISARCSFIKVCKMLYTTSHTA